MAYSIGIVHKSEAKGEAMVTVDLKKKVLLRYNYVVSITLKIGYSFILKYRVSLASLEYI